MLAQREKRIERRERPGNGHAARQCAERLRLALSGEGDRFEGRVLLDNTGVGGIREPLAALVCLDRVGAVQLREAKEPDVEPLYQHPKVSLVELIDKPDPLSPRAVTL